VDTSWMPESTRKPVDSAPVESNPRGTTTARTTAESHRQEHA